VKSSSCVGFLEFLLARRDLAGLGEEELSVALRDVFDEVGVAWMKGKG